MLRANKVHAVEQIKTLLAKDVENAIARLERLRLSTNEYKEAVSILMETIKQLLAENSDATT